MPYPEGSNEWKALKTEQALRRARRAEESDVLGEIFESEPELLKEVDASPLRYAIKMLLLKAVVIGVQRGLRLANNPFGRPYTIDEIDRQGR